MENQGGFGRKIIAFKNGGRNQTCKWAEWEGSRKQKTLTLWVNLKLK